ncbi:MAG: DNA polymerase IV, partial [archaeon]|nr:DNA polymerase IV [archaeon]
EMGLTCSVGLSYCMAAAKTASEEMKPDGYFEIRTPEEFASMMAGRDVRRLYSVGPRTADRLLDMGIETVSDIIDRRNDVERLFGQHGRFLTGLAQGIDDREVTPYRPEDAKSVSRETTFQRDVSDYLLLMDVLLLMSIDIHERAERYRLRGSGVTIKISYAGRRTVTRNRNGLVIRGPMDIAHAAWDLLDGSGRDAVRLIGVGMTGLSSDRMVQTLLVPSSSDQADVGELEHHLGRMGRRYGLEFLGENGIFGHERFHEVIEQMRVQSVRRTGRARRKTH